MPLPQAVPQIGGAQVLVPGMPLAEKAAQQAQGTAMGEARANLPKAETTAAQALKTIEDIRNHPGRKYATGALAKTAEYLPGTNQYDFAKLLEQAKSGAFLSAYQTLRGGGAISNAEGAKAEGALARMDAAQSRAGFDKALNDYRDVIQQGLSNQQRIARGDMQPYTAAAATSTSPTVASVQPPPGFKQHSDGHYYSEKPGPNGKYQVWTP
jgi:hypothetical protein